MYFEYFLNVHKTLQSGRRRDKKKKKTTNARSNPGIVIENQNTNKELEHRISYNWSRATKCTPMAPGPIGTICFTSHAPAPSIASHRIAMHRRFATLPFICQSPIHTHEPNATLVNAFLYRRQLACLFFNLFQFHCWKINTRRPCKKIRFPWPREKKSH